MIEIVQAHPSRMLDEGRLLRVLEATLAGEGAEAGEVTVVLTDHTHVHDLNRTHLAHDYETDVLSFWLGADDGEGPVEGEIYVDLDTAFERHQEFGASFETEVERYCVHGLLHLVGHDDATPDEKAAMHALEDFYLQTP